MENKIIKFLDELLVYNWKKLDMFNDMFEQSDEYRKILDEFKILIFQESQRTDFNFDYAYELLNLYSEQIQSIMYFGSIKHLVNTNLLPSQLKKIIKEIEFQGFKTNENFLKCECSVRSKFDIEPKAEFLTRLGCNFDGYYDTYIYKCKICEFGWMVTVDDINGTGFYKIWDRRSFPINNINCI